MRPEKTRTQIGAEATQRAIVEAAARLFTAHGYHATSIGRIAAEAGVVPQTIYNSVGSKRDVLSRVLDFAAAGERAPVPVPRFMHEQAEREPDPRRIIAQLVDLWRGALPRTAPVFRVIREAAAADPEIAALERARSAPAAGELPAGGRDARRARCAAQRVDDRGRRGRDLRDRPLRGLPGARDRRRLGRRRVGGLGSGDARGRSARAVPAPVGEP